MTTLEQREKIKNLLLKNPNLVFSDIAHTFPKLKSWSFMRIKNNIFKTNNTGKQIYTTIFERKIEKNISDESLNLLQEVIESLNSKRITNLQIVETIKPNHVLEIRSFTK